MSLLTHFFTEVKKDGYEWTIKCNLCLTKIKSTPTVTSNFHRHLRDLGFKNKRFEMSKVKLRFEICPTDSNDKLLPTPSVIIERERVRERESSFYFV